MTARTKKQISIPIRIKFLSVLGILLVGAVGTYILLASRTFREDKVVLINEMNLSTVSSVASNIRALLNESQEQLKSKLLFSIFSSAALNVESDARDSSNFVGFDFYKKEGETYDTFGRVPETSRLKLELKKIMTSLESQASQAVVFWHSKQPEQSVRFFLASRLNVTTSMGKEFYLAVGEIKPTSILTAFQISNLDESYLVLGNGDVLAHYEGSEPSDLDSIPAHPLLTKFKQQSVNGVASYSYKDKEFFGALSPVGVANLYILSQISSKEVNQAISTLYVRSLLYGSLILTVAFLVSILFARRLTKHLETLSRHAKTIGQGNLAAHVEIKSRDEVEELGNTFNWMTQALHTSWETIQRHNEELEQKVRDRTLQIETKNRAIQEIQEKLIHASHLAAVGETAGRVAHEVLNPLTAIIGRIENSVSIHSNQTDGSEKVALQIVDFWKQEIAQGGVDQLLASLRGSSQLDPSMTLLQEDLANFEKLLNASIEEKNRPFELMKFVLKEAERIQGIVNEMRKFVRSSTNKERYNCYQGIRESLLAMSDYFSKNKVELRAEFLAPDPYGVMNGDEFIQILRNLMRNAVQAMLESSILNPTLTIRVSNEKMLLFVDIIDNGPGITADVQPKLFEQGFTTKSVLEGTGLGLSICRRYARAFGGDVVLHSSQLGHGTCFRIQVPLSPSQTLMQAA